MLISLRSPGSSESRLLGISDDGRWSEPATTADADLGTGLWAVPGMADAHAHLAATSNREPGDPDGITRRAFACLRSGVFLIIDKGWSDNSVVATLSDLPPGRRPDWEGAPRMISVEGGYYPDFAVEVEPGDLARVVEDAANLGGGWVKLVGDWPRRGRGAVANFSEEDLAEAVAVAHRGGARVAIHTMAPDVASAAVRAGVDSIEHGLFLTETDLELLAERRGAWVPTVLRMDQTAEMLGPDSTGGRLISEGLRNVASLLADVPAGVAVLAGSDMAVTSGEIGREVVRLHQMGLEASRAAAAATTAAYRYLSRPSGFVPGEPANAVFFAADPSAEPATMVEPVAVIRSGKVLT